MSPGSSSIRWRGSTNAINAALAALQYKGPAGFSGADMLFVVCSDGGATGAGPPVLTHAVSIPVVVMAVDDAPVLLGVPAGGLATREDTPLALDMLQVSDGDSLGQGQGAPSLSMTATAAASEASFMIGHVSHWVTVAGNGTTAVTWTGPVTDVNATLATLVYTPAPDFHGATSATISVNGGNLFTTNVDIMVSPVNDAPRLLIGGAGSEADGQGAAHR